MGRRSSLSSIIFPSSLSFPIPDPLLSTPRRSSVDSVDSDDSDDFLPLKRRDDVLASDEENEKLSLLAAEADEESLIWDFHLASSRSRRRRLLQAGLLFPLVLFLVLFLTFLGSNWFSGRHTYRGGSLLPITWGDVANGTFAVKRERLEWLAEAGDGVYSTTKEGSILLQDVRTNTSRVLVNGDDVKDKDGNKLQWNSFSVSADLKYILFDVDWTKQWRHSSLSNYYVHLISSSRTVPLLPPTFPPHTALATFSPKDHHIAFVHANDLWVYDTPPTNKGAEENWEKQAIRVTNTGSPTTFNGVPDWVYEEEVFSSPSALWWSPKGSKLAYLSFDEESVPEYEFPIYNPSPYAPGGKAYPDKVVMRYPKPGFPNPLVTLQVFHLSNYLSLSAPSTHSFELDVRVPLSTLHLEFSKPFPKNSTIITEVTWLSDTELLVKATNRISSIERVALFVIDDQVDGEEDAVITGRVVRERDWSKEAGGDGGWVEPGQFVVGIESTVLLHSQSSFTPRAPLPSYAPGYLDVIPDQKGFNHIAYFSPPESKDPIFLTTGEWELDGGIQSVDVKRGVIYFIAANPSIERHLYSIPLPTKDQLSSLKSAKLSAPLVLTNTTERGYHRVSFSPFGGFYVLNYEGPNIPWQRLVNVDDSHFVNVLTDNAELAAADAQFIKAEVTYTTVTVDGLELNVMELRPPLMDVTGRTKYPVLFQVYGGPASQKVATNYFRDWHHFLCTSLNYIIVMVDPRGTGYKGRGFRMPVRERLGEFEANDTVEVGRYYKGLKYVDEKRIGIWGWSYGGYLTSKVIETNSSVFTLGISVAPVTDWAYYDSIYTERYMSTPELNPDGYLNSAVTKMDGFQNVDFALAHGSGDDNVHFLNSAALLDRLTVAAVRRFRFRLFVDSDHSMSMRNGYWELMPWLTAFLEEKWGEGGRTKMKWKLTAHEVAYGQ